MEQHFSISVVLINVVPANQPMNSAHATTFSRKSTNQQNWCFNKATIAMAMNICSSDKQRKYEITDL